MICGIYQIRNVMSGKRHIGRTRDIDSRCAQHECNLNANCHENPHLQRSFNKGNEFIFEVLIYCDDYDVIIGGKPSPIFWEKWFFDDYVRWGYDYNINSDAENPPIIEWTDDMKQEQSERVSGENNPMYGKPGTWLGKLRPDQSRLMLGNNYSKGLKLSEEHKRKIGESCKGIKHSEESRHRHSEAAKRQWADHKLKYGNVPLNVTEGIVDE